MFSSAKSLNKVESLLKSDLRFLSEYYVSPNEELLQKAGKETIKVNRLRSLCIEIYKSINIINLTHMNEIFKLRKTRSAVHSNNKFNLDVPTTKLVLVIRVLNTTGLKLGIHSLFTRNLLRIWRHLRIL